MAATVIDVVREFQSRIAALPITSAYFLYNRVHNTIVFTTFFEDIDHKAEAELAEIEGYMIDSFSEFLLDFRTIHLLGRDDEGFVPDGSVPLIARRGSFHRLATHK